MIRKIFLLSLIFCAVSCFGQEGDILKRPITIKLQNQNIGKVLEILSETNSFYFSYNPTEINTTNIVSVHAENKPLKEVLDRLFDDQVSYLQIGNHIILKPKPDAKPPLIKQNKSTIYYYNISGYLREDISGLGLSDISVFEKEKLTSTLSQDFGYYELKFNSKQERIEIFYSGAIIDDTSIIVYGTSQPVITTISFQLQYKSKGPKLLPSIAALSDSMQILTVSADSLSRLSQFLNYAENKLDSLKLTKKLSNKLQRIAVSNIRDSFERDWQFTFIPPMATNGKLSPLVKNKYSLNLLAGYNGGVQGLEIGGMVNLVRKNMNGVQIAGFGNAVGGECHGVQIAGFFNHNLGAMNGTQISGFYNYNSSKTKGLQIAGFTNYAKELEGVQIAGFLNRAKTLKGFQLGIINIADTLNGASFGLFNYVRTGLHQFEIGYNYAGDLQLAFRSGTDAFYTHFNIFAAPAIETSNPWVGFGYGIGHNFKISKAFLINLEVQSQQITKKMRIDYLSMINHLKLNLEVRPKKGIAIYGGLGIANTLFETNDPNLNELRQKYGMQYQLTPNNDLQVNLNPTWQFGLRFF